MKVLAITLLAVVAAAQAFPSELELEVRGNPTMCALQYYAPVQKLSDRALILIPQLQPLIAEIAMASLKCVGSNSALQCVSDATVELLESKYPELGTEVKSLSAEAKQLFTDIKECLTSFLLQLDEF